MKRPEYTVRLLRVAEDDFIEIVSYVSAESPEAAEALAEKIERNLGLLATNPSLGRVPEDDALINLGYRYLVVQNYLIFYVVENRTIFIHRIIHGARDYIGLF
ncbi:MAG TPA: type II toxin-antitoxin system RelE/ParE family toxin [Blastocatellia bacterium]|nr:type II toxin-antitoxin system RelE/ParE family toxin [Blastocatellia bacterium]